MHLTKYLNPGIRHAEIRGIATSCFGNDEQVQFIEEYIPARGRVPEPKVANFEGFLLRATKHLWAIYENDAQNSVVGFVLIADIPHQNSIGFGIEVNYARQGIMRKAWEEIEPQLVEIGVPFPLNGYTSARNEAANAFMTAIGFILQEGEIDFEGETRALRDFVWCSKGLRCWVR